MFLVIHSEVKVIVAAFFHCPRSCVNFKKIHLYFELSYKNLPVCIEIKLYFLGRSFDQKPGFY